MTQDRDIFDRALIVRRRERFAGSAGSHDFLLRHVADDVTDRLSLILGRFPVAANVGAYHGLLSRRLRRLANIDLVIDMEPSLGLLAQCEGPKVRAEDELVPFRAGSLDLVVSGLALQLVNDLPGTLAQLARALKPDGLLLAAVLGGRTLFELREAFALAEAEVENGASPRVAPFADVRDLGSLLQRAGLALPVVDSDVLTVRYATPLHLMRDIQAMAAANPMLERRRQPLRRAVLLRAAQIYTERHAASDGRIAATYEIITLTGWAPHASQQKPLRPGSASNRLAQALGVPELPAGEKTGG